ncbi:MAG: bifunctional phosphopantothenoylcysteine decarboxylase/phosphopantothenate--cysteine ligase CoaBC, partial [Fusobacteriaceae bacterium]
MKNILIGVTGGIAAYKSATIISLLKKRGYNVKVIMTKNATEIITPLTLETLSRERVVVDMWDKNRGYEVEHISLAEWADLILIAPTTYNIIGKIANGIADDMLSTVISAATKPIFFALAMNNNMYDNPILKDNIEKLKRYGYNFIESDEGFLACNTNAKGRMKNPEEIVQIIEEFINLEKIEKKFLGKKILITAGRTEEPLDPIRYLSNLSSGKMGYALAKIALKMGAEVTLISGPTNIEPPIGVNLIRVRTALEMYDRCLEIFPSQDIGIGCAAVADYRPKMFSNSKIKKKDGDLIIELERNPDILHTLGQSKMKSQKLIGFAAETENIIEYAKGKLLKKNLDMIVANHASNMQSNFNSVTLIKNDGKILSIDNMEKDKIAIAIL